MDVNMVGGGEEEEPESGGSGEGPGRRNGWQVNDDGYGTGRNEGEGGGEPGGGEEEHRDTEEGREGGAGGDHVDPYISKVEGGWKCNKCNKTVKQKGNMKQHVQTHLPNQNITCRLCGGYYKNKHSHSLLIFRVCQYFGTLTY